MKLEINSTLADQSEQAKLKSECAIPPLNGCGKQGCCKQPLAITIPHFLQSVGIGKTLCYRLIKSGKLKSIRIGTRRLILMTSVEALLSGDDL